MMVVFHNYILSVRNRIGKKRKAHTESDKVDLEILRQLRDLDRKDPELEPDKEDLYARSMAGSLRKMTPEQRALAKMKIQQILYETQYCMPQAPYPGTYQQDNYY